MRTLKWIMAGEDVATLQRALKEQGYLIGNIDGQFGWETREAVIEWQHAHGLPMDGVAGQATLALLGLDATVGSVPGALPAATHGGIGRSLHIGLNRVDPGRYAGWAGQLHGCENDARTMGSIAKAERFTTTYLLTRNATSRAVLAAIGDAAKSLKSGDTFLLTYSGHGGQVPNRSAADDEEADQQDETWVLYDRMLIDDELALAFGAFQKGVNIILLSDSCHSGTVYRRMPSLTGRDRAIPPDVLDLVLKQHGDMYASIYSSLSRAISIVANGLTINACQDNQLAQEVNGAGVFTTLVNKTWANGIFRASYAAFHRQIVAQMPPQQTPQLSLFGADMASLVSRTPFKRTGSVRQKVVVAGLKAA